MKKGIAALLMLLVLGLAANGQAVRRAQVAATVVVYNSIDPASKELAEFYAEQRGIAADRLVPLEFSMKEEITREEYDRTIATPLRQEFLRRGWWKSRTSETGTVVEENNVRFLVLMRGVPLKISGVATYPGDTTQQGPAEIVGRNDAAVDSELAALPLFLAQISGVLNNPYYRSFTRFMEMPLPGMMLVARLDGPTPATVRRMIKESIAAEKNGLWGMAYIDSRSINDGGLAEGDKWLTALAKEARSDGIPVIQDNGPEMFPDNYPMRHAAFYYGWYAQDVAGPFLRPDFAFVPGAVAVHIHSFSASTVRDPARAWVGPLLAKGAAATMGNVYEPYLALTPNLDILHNRLHAGFTFGEASYMSLRGLSWMTTVVGDPLYRPFPPVGDLPATAESAEWRAYRDGARLWYGEDRAAGGGQLEKVGRQMKSGVILEGLASLQAEARQYPLALESFQQARAFYGDREDVARVTLREASLLRAMNRPRDALSLIRKQLRALDETPTAPLLRSVETQLDPPPPAAR